MRAPVLIGVARVPCGGVPGVTGARPARTNFEGRRSGRPDHAWAPSAATRWRCPRDGRRGAQDRNLDERGRPIVRDDDVLEADVVVADGHPRELAWRGLTAPDGTRGRPESGDRAMQAALEAGDADEQLIACGPGGEGRDGDVAGEELRAPRRRLPPRTRGAPPGVALEVPQERVVHRRSSQGPAGRRTASPRRTTRPSLPSPPARNSSAGSSSIVVRPCAGRSERRCVRGRARSPVRGRAAERS